MQTTPTDPSKVIRALDEVYCWQCGRPHSAAAVICVNCGCEARPIPGSRAVVRTGRRRDVAVVLAAFLSYWAWLYTFKDDWRKFIAGVLVGVPSSLATIIVLIGGPDVFGPPPYALIALLLAATPGIAVWIWAITLNTARTTNWFRDYDQRTG